MHNLMKRLERLEQNAPESAEPVRIVRVILSNAEGGGAAPWHPMWARARHGDEATILRDHPLESVEAFEARALGHFASHFIIGSGAM